MNSKTERSASPKVTRINKQITSKIDSGVSKKSSTLTVIKSRQHSNASRTSSKQSIDDKKAPGKPRSASSASSTRFSQSSSQSIVGDKLQQSIHKLGQLPSYLRGNRPASAVSKLKPTESETRRKIDKGIANIEPTEKALELESFQSFRNNLSPQYGSYANSKAVMDGLVKKPAPEQGTTVEPNVSSPPKATDLEQAIAQICTEIGQIDSTKPAACPPCEGEGSGDAALQQVAQLGQKLPLSDVRGKMRQLEAKCERLEADCKRKRDRILELEAEVAAKISTIKDRERDAERRKSKVRVLSGQVEDLKAKLAKAGHALEEKETQLFELEEKKVEKDVKIEKQSKENEALRQQAQELSQRIDLLTQQIADKDATIAVLKTEDTVKIVETELEVHRSEVDALQKELKQLRFENDMLVNVKKQDDILVQVRSNVLDSLENTKDMFKATCDEMLCYAGDGEFDIARHMRTADLDARIEALTAKSSRCCEEEEIIGKIQQNNQNCKTMRNTLLEMLKRLQAENREMREIIRSNCEQATTCGSDLDDQRLGQLCQLLSDEPLLQEETIELDTVEEEILSRINYDNDQILSEDGNS